MTNRVNRKRSFFVHLHAMLAMTLLLAAGCSGMNGGEDPPETPTPTATPNQTPVSPTPTPGVTPPSPTPDPSSLRPFTDPVVTICESLAPLEGGICAVTPGGSSRLLVGTVLVPGEVLRGGQVLVDDKGRISCVGCDCSGQAGDATRITCPEGVISPGLINSHDHITFTHNDPYTDTGERYEHRHDWRKGKRGHTQISASGGASSDQVRWGELRFLMGGATSTVGSGSATGLLRNLDRSEQEGLNQEPVHYETFPLDDSDGTQRSSGCNYGSDPDTESDILGDDSYVPHVGEGIDQVTRNEFLCTSTNEGEANDLVQKQSAFIHSVGFFPADYALMAHDGTGVIWSPRSNVTLYGDTAITPLILRLGVPVSLGTDWMPTGSMNMLRELRCADDLNSIYFDGFFNDEQLWLMATLRGAQLTATDDVIGVLQSGRIADISIFHARGRIDHRAVIDAEPEDVLLVMREGEVLYGDAALLTDLGTTSCDVLDVCGSSKRVCLQGDISKTYAQLKSSAGDIYPAWFCGVPDDEPSCHPERPTSVTGSTIYDGVPTASDGDGDGHPDNVDNCPRFFNPVRPHDNGEQADADGDGLGDSCDPCPLDPHLTVCATFDPNDRDGDGVADAIDNCPDIRNADQSDIDGDTIGDVCDPCPEFDNSSGAACPSDVYAVKSGQIPAGTEVSLGEVLVTGRSNTGFFSQVPEDSQDYQGPEFSGIFTYGAYAVEVGDRIEILTATVNEYYGQWQLTDVTYSLLAVDQPHPAPLEVADPASIGIDNPEARALEAMLVTVTGLEITELNPPLGPGDKEPDNEFVVNDVLRVNDLLYLLAPFPTLGEQFTRLTGLLEWRNGNFKIEIRGPQDVLSDRPTLLSFGPTGQYAREGQSGSTFPERLTLTLSRATSTDVLVTLDSSLPGALVPLSESVEIPAGGYQAEVQVEALAPATDVTLTASLSGSSLSTSLEVLGLDAPAQLVSLTPEEVRIGPGATQVFVLTLDRPAPQAGVTVTLKLDQPEAAQVPARVTVPMNALLAEFELVDLEAASQLELTATEGEQSFISRISVVRPTSDHLVINEVDYDQANDDTGEFIEIYNGTGAAVSLSDYAVSLINGSDSAEYLSVPLASLGTLAADSYLVLATPSLTVAADALVLRFSQTSNNVQNGGPDGIALIKYSDGTLVDALSYEGSITAAKISTASGTVTHSLVEGVPFAAVDLNDSVLSFIRDPNGVDSNNAAEDWTSTTRPSPGAANTP